jgi:hypothetical protein
LALWEEIEQPSASPQPLTIESKPRWDGVILWYGKTKLRSYQRKEAPVQAAILNALEEAGWAIRRRNGRTT